MAFYTQESRVKKKYLKLRFELFFESNYLDSTTYSKYNN